MLPESVNGTEVLSWQEEGIAGRVERFGTTYRVVYEFTGSPERPIISLGTAGAGLYLKDGEIVAINENGSQAVLTNSDSG